MKALFDQLSHDCSQKVTSTYSTSFSLAVKMLSPKIQGAIHSIYGFVRLADEIVDTFPVFNSWKQPVAANYSTKMLTCYSGKNRFDIAL